MVFGLLLGVIFCIIVFIHYLQGFFSAALSAVIAVFAAMLAFSYHEVIVDKLLQGKAANIAHSMVLVALFAVIYLILRSISDKVIPEDVKMPTWVRRIGGALMGVVAATFCTGIIAIAAEELPYGAAVLGYTKYATNDNIASVPGERGTRSRDGSNFDELVSDKAGQFVEADRKNTFPWAMAGVDEIVVSTVGHLSESGSLQGSQPLNAIHPDFLQELYGQRAGVQAGATHVAFNSPDAPEPVFTVHGVFTTPKVRIEDPELKTVRRLAPKVVPPLTVVSTKSGQVKNEKDMVETVIFQYVQAGKDPETHQDQMLVIIRVSFGIGAADHDDAMIRFSPGSCRLVAKRTAANGNLEPFNYYPLGTLERARNKDMKDVVDSPVLYTNKPDDFLFVPLGSHSDGRPGVDLCYVVDKKGFLSESKINSGVFFEFKRLCREDLSGLVVTGWTDVSPGVGLGVLHKKEFSAPSDAATRPSTATPAKK